MLSGLRPPYPRRFSAHDCDRHTHRRSTLIALLPLLLAAATPPAAASDPGFSSDDIVVTAPGKPFRVADGKLRAAQAAFAENRPGFAPQARLLWRLRPIGAKDMSTFRLTLMGPRGATIPVPLDADHRFELPAIPAGRWTLVGSSGGVRLGADILSPGTAEADRRLGDLRLECRVIVAVVDINFLLRGMFNAAGGCASSRFQMFHPASHPIGEAFALSGPRRLPLAISPKRRAYEMPLANKTLDNDTRVKLTFAD
ncbi:hypothetical protein PQ455_17055 [Sphingomonas naphthae]|uniref:Uncharacterized protein n=1 Tax=Sphingomonas naphthae TaxID=1813468 RepID=A0ABY7TKJ1_9SPHN|nr:hypothetical protein [Sphingomonas naphthae]WCT73301.1 hypothetical protein PQ455_17055 [Sphingomonas naphthae]